MACGSFLHVSSHHPSLVGRLAFLDSLGLIQRTVRFSYNIPPTCPPSLATIAAMASSSSSSSSSEIDNQLTLAERISKAQQAFASLPEELRPPSRPGSPQMSARAQGLKQAIVKAVTEANSNPTHPKWGHVTHMVKLQCTRRGYKSVEEGVRIGDTQKANITNVEWMLPETEEEWDRYVRRWGKKFNSRNRTSKYFQTEEADEIEHSPTRKAEIIRERITTWQANVVAMEDPAPSQDVRPSTPVEGTTTSMTAVEKGKAQEAILPGGLSQSSLGFTVGKRPTVPTAKKQVKPNNDPPIPAAPEPRQPQKPPSDVRMSSSLPQSEAVAPVVDAPQPTPNPGPNAVIAEVSEMVSTIEPNVEPLLKAETQSFLPPSFPSQLQTSTPPRDKARAKPPPILPSSPLSSPPPTQHITKPALASPFAQRAQKRSRNDSPRQNDAMDISDELRPRRSPPNKKQRTTVPERESSMPIPPPSTPPPVSSCDHEEDVSPVLRHGLGNANGLPIAPTTPERKTLPTLTELLATSRRSKARPRPPSRKTKSTNPSPLKTTLLPAAEISTRADGEAGVAADRSPSPARTFFSSPASGSSSSSPRFRARSPVSPLFSQNPHAFAPAFVSSQPGGLLGFGGAGSQAPLPLARTESGLLALGYNSQFDVEGGVSRAAELLDRDVDYADWLRDIPEAEDEASMRQSQEGLAV